MSATSIFSLPIHLWDLYVEYLWNYEAGSWVGRTAWTFRVMAFLLIMPLAVLAMLDVASYVIARTLGVIDATKASTSGVAARESRLASDEGVPSIHISASSKEATQSSSSTTVFTETETGTETESALFKDNPIDEGNLRLAGVDAFSPTPSQRSSPTLSRRDLELHGHHQYGLGLKPMTKADESGEYFPRVAGSDDEDTEGVQMRRRKRRVEEDAS